jgi:hypothetical protein
VDETPKSTPAESLLPVPAPLAFDVQASNPLQDLWILFKKPDFFFEYFRGVPLSQNFSNWIWAKAFLCFFFFQWLSLLGIGPFGWESLLPLWESFKEVLGPRSAMLPYLLPDAKVLHHEAGRLFVFFNQLRIIFTPLLALLKLFTLVWVASLGLRLLGVSREGASKRRLMLCGLYANVFVGFAILPGIGGLLRLVIPFMYFLKALHVLSGKQGYLRVWFASYGLYYAILLMTALFSSLMIVLAAKILFNI